MDNFSFLVEVETISVFRRCFLFWRPVACFNNILFFSHLFRVIPSDNLSRCQRTVFHLSHFLRKLPGDVDSRELLSQTVCHHNRELVLLELFSQTSFFINLTSFGGRKSVFKREGKRLRALLLVSLSFLWLVFFCFPIHGIK